MSVRFAWSVSSVTFGTAPSRIITWDRIVGSEFRFCDGVDGLTFESPAPVHEDADGFYPVPIPGKWNEV